MVNSSSKNNSFMGVESICETHSPECDHGVVENTHPLKKYLYDLWLNIQLFFEKDKWEHNVTLKVGDAHYTIKMEDLESRWRNP